MSAPQQALLKQPGQLRFRQVESIVEDVSRMRQTITNRAYEIFCTRESGEGTHLDDWLTAERELTWKPAVELTEQDGILTLEVAIAGLKPDEFDVQLTSEDVLIQSERADAEPDDTVNVLLAERTGRLFREIHLPVSIEADRAEARYRHGLLRITAPVAGTDAREPQDIQDPVPQQVPSEEVRALE